MIFVDAHVHIYNCFDLKVFFNAALNNFKKEAAKQGKENNYASVLILTDWSGQNWFKRLGVYANQNGGKENKKLGNLTFSMTSECCSIIVRRDDGESLFLISGRKIITSENLEVLALATDTEFENGLPLNKTIQVIRDSCSIPVIPWAVGKWMGRRGKILSRLLESAGESEFFLCDNGNRPIFWPRPSHFGAGEKKGIRVISGSDPLHFASEVHRVGSFGFSIQETINHEQPAKHLQDILMDQSTTFKLFGNLENPYRFIKNQLAMQVLKRKWTGAYE